MAIKFGSTLRLYDLYTELNASPVFGVNSAQIVRKNDCINALKYCMLYMESAIQKNAQKSRDQLENNEVFHKGYLCR